MTAETLRRAFAHILRGEFGTVFRGATRKLEDQIENIPDTVDYVCDEDPPQWLRPQGGVQTFQITESAYVSLLATSDEFRFTINSEQPVRAVEIPVVAPEKADRVRISQSIDGSDEPANEFQLLLESSYDYPSVLWRTLPVSQGASATDVRISVDQESSLLNRLCSSIQTTAIGLPAVVPTAEQPPIFLISIDTLRYDRQDELRSLINELGQNAMFPTEPRVQGTWTPPSHASMFTGAHPGQHGYVGYGKASGDRRPINPALTMIPELLAANGYKNSAVVSHMRILPEFGFGRGFHRFCHDGMSYSDWITRNSDAKASVNRLINWIEQDLAVRDHSLFYFLHVFDPHYPYIPPTERLSSPDIDFSKSKKFKRHRDKVEGDDWTYVDGYHNEYELDSELIREMKEWYSKSVAYTGDQIARLLRYLKGQDLFDDSLIIITGDHGEEFGERGFFTHTSLYDGNIRPFMAVKPPAAKSWPQKDHIDTIDFLPTVAQLVGETIPEYCQGTPIQFADEQSPRITERIYPDWYSISVEHDTVRGIFTYDANYPDRPTQDVIQHGPELEEFYNLSAVRNDVDRAEEIRSERKEKLRQTATEFLLDASTRYTAAAEATRPSQETSEQLRNLGYK